MFIFLCQVFLSLDCGHNIKLYHLSIFVKTRKFWSLKATKLFRLIKSTQLLVLGRQLGKLFGHLTVIIKIRESLMKKQPMTTTMPPNCKQVFDAEWSFRINARSTKNKQEPREQRWRPSHRQTTSRKEHPWWIIWEGPINF